MPLDEFTRRMDEFSQMVKSRAPRPGFAEVLLPGEQEARRVARKSADGVPLDDEVLAELPGPRPRTRPRAEIVATGPCTRARL